MKEKIKQILRQRECRRISDPSLISSAVLVPFYKKGSEWYLLFIKRTDTVTNHKGQISFPGGKREESDHNSLATALREGFEEIGLAPEAAEIIGRLDDEKTIGSNFVVHPYVVVIPYPYEFKLSTAEVAHLVEVPISALIDKSNLREEIITDRGETIPAYYFHYGDQVVWGATARILKKFLDLTQYA